MNSIDNQVEHVEKEHATLNKDSANCAEYALGELDTFTEYLNTLDFGPGQRDYAAHKAFLRAGSLGIRPQDALSQVVEKITGTGGTFDQGKIKSQLRRAYEFVGSEASGLKAVMQPPKATFNPEALKRCASKVGGIDADWLRKHSPVPVAAVSSSGFLEHLYHAGERIVVFTTFRSQGQAIYEVGCANNAQLPTGSPDGVWFLVNPVDGQYRRNPRQDDKLSRRSEESVTSWRYLVLESDVADPNEWLACLVQFPLRIVAVYTSGGKSIHALVRLDAASKQDWDEKRDKIKSIMVTLGADENALTAVRLSRLPVTMRGDHQQELLYLNPKADGTPIIERGN